MLHFTTLSSVSDWMNACKVIMDDYGLVKYICYSSHWCQHSLILPITSQSSCILVPIFTSISFLLKFVSRPVPGIQFSTPFFLNGKGWRGRRGRRGGPLVTLYRHTEIRGGMLSVMLKKPVCMECLLNNRQAMEGRFKMCTCSSTQVYVSF